MAGITVLGLGQSVVQLLEAVPAPVAQGGIPGLEETEVLIKVVAAVLFAVPLAVVVEPVGEVAAVEATMEAVAVAA